MKQGDHPCAVCDGPTKRPQYMRISRLITVTYLPSIEMYWAVEQAVLFRLFRYFSTVWNFDFPEVTTSNVTFSTCLRWQVTQDIRRRRHHSQFPPTITQQCVCVCAVCLFLFLRNFAGASAMFFWRATFPICHRYLAILAALLSTSQQEAVAFHTSLAVWSQGPTWMRRKDCRVTSKGIVNPLPLILSTPPIQTCGFVLSYWGSYYWV